MPVINYIAALLSLSGLVLIVRLIHKGMFRERYALIWLFSGVTAVLVCTSPETVERISHALEVTVPMNLLLFLAVIFLAGVCMMLTVVVSKQAMRIEILAKELGLLRNEIAD